MPTTLDPGEERPVTGPSGPPSGVTGPSGPPSGVTDAENPADVVVLVDGRGAVGPGATKRRRPPARRSDGQDGPRAGPPEPSGTGENPVPRVPVTAAALARADFGPAVPGDSASPGPPVKPDRPSRRDRRQAHRDRRPDGSFLRRNLRVPGTLGLVIVVLALALGTGFVGAVIWASNDARNIRTTPNPISPPRRTDAPGEAEVTTTTKPDLSAASIAEKMGPSVWEVRTFDSIGRPVQGSAFLTQSGNGQSLLLTSLAVVEASTYQPAPEITVVGSGFNGKAVLWTWDDAHDLALLVVGGTDTTALSWIGDPAKVKVGDKIFALGADAKVKPGLVSAISDQALEHNVFVDDAFRGGPIVNVKGEVVAVSSAVYTGGGTPTETLFFAIPVRASCAAVLTCTGAFAGPGTPVASIPPRETTTTTEPD